MRVLVVDDTGTRFEYETNKEHPTMCLCPGKEEVVLVVEALQEAVKFLTGPPVLFNQRSLV